MKHSKRILEIDLDSIADNVVLLKKITGKKILACVKCDGYGLGAIPVSKKIEKHIDWFGVATVDEAVALRKSGIIKPVLVLGPAPASEAKKAIDYNISLAAASMDFINKIQSARNLSVHIKVDTGMGRIGILPQHLNEAVRIIRKSKVKIEGIFSHFSNSENPDRFFSLKQIKIFSEALSVIPARSKIITHIANSGGIVNVPESVESFSMVRTGLLLYGVYPTLFLRVFKKISGLRYALKGTAEILLVRDVPAGSAISYGGTYVCSKDTRIAIIGIGYGDGLDRSLSNRFFMKHNDKLFPVRGRICMDQTILEIDQTLDEGSKIVFLDQELSVEDMAQMCNTVPQEILTRFGVSRLKKVYLGKRN
ncbi:MAG: alanine racemase [Candidatus Omnitrophica bacterium]|nr:alanine racemase [Candidatus Omnitrophota bacterium]MCM8828081.1 alanine racemase [Candidatus Omnitrophota bacterium]